MAYLSNIELKNQGDMSELLTRSIVRTKSVLGAFVCMDHKSGTSFLLGDTRRKGGRTRACDGGKMTLPQIQSPILLIFSPHGQSQ